MKKLVSLFLSLALAVSLSIPAFAAEPPHSAPASITQEYGASVGEAISSIQNTIDAINSLKTKGMVPDVFLQDLAAQFDRLDKAVIANGSRAADAVKSVIQDAENAIRDLSDADDVQTAIDAVKADLVVDTDDLSRDTITAENKSAAVKSFRDVPSNHWAHDAIMDMVKMELFTGTTSPDANGVGTFSPKKSMTRAEFITVVTRYLYQDALTSLSQKYGKPDVWYEYNYNVAVDHGIIKTTEFARSDMNVAMSRQEMAMVLVRAAGKAGDSAEQLIHTQRIPDYVIVGDYYQDYVRECYSMGMICGTNSQGAFNPYGILNRAQAATVLYRLVKPETRIKVDFSTPQQQTDAITIYEGQPSYRPAKAGDTFVKADGTKVVLKIGPSGVLGEGQGVAPDKNLAIGEWTAGRFNYDALKLGRITDSTGNGLQNQEYYINDTTGEGHWMKELQAMSKNYPKPKTPGTYTGQVSENTHWWWDGDYGAWISNYSLNK